MDYSQLNTYTYAELAKFATDMDLKVHRSKSGLVQEITNAFREYEAYKKDKIDKYVRVKRIGEHGQESTTYLVTTKSGTEYIMKTFRKHKSSAILHKEADLQKIAADAGTAPNIVDEDTVSKYIVMEKMDKDLASIMVEQGNSLTRDQQKQIIAIHKKLDKAGIFHGDIDLANYMYRNDTLLITNFGQAREITPSLIQKLGTDSPNMSISLLALALKLREMGCPSSSYDYIVKYLSPEQKLQNKFCKTQKA
jgi:serine/threonine protein kinase